MAMNRSLTMQGPTQFTPPAANHKPDCPHWLARRRVTSLLLASGWVSSLLYVIAIDVIAARHHSDYHNYTSQMVSELIAVGAPTRKLLTWLFIPYNVIVFLFAAGVWRAAGTRRSARLLAVALAGYGISSTAGLLVAPMDLRGTPNSRRDPLHIVATIVMSLFIIAAMAFGAFVRGVKFRLYTFATIGAVVVFGVSAGLLARPMPGPTPRLGIAERVNIYATMLWFAVLAIVLSPARGRQAKAPAEPGGVGLNDP